MKRNIVTTIEFSKGQISLVALEKFSSNNVVEIFSAKGSVKQAREFLSASLGKIGESVGGPVKNVNVVLEMSPNIGANVTLTKLEYTIPGKEITAMDIDNALELVRKEHQTNNSIPILIQPIRFDVQGASSKSYSQAPLHKFGKNFNMVCAVTTISSVTYEFVAQLVKSANVEMNQILLEPQSVSQNRLSENALSSGSILLHVGESHSYIAVTKNMAVVGIMPIYSLGFRALLAGISKSLMCSAEKAQDLFLTYGTFDESKDSRIIFSRQIGLREEQYTSGHLRNILTQYMQNMMLQVTPWLRQRNIANLPTVISGEISRLDKIEALIKLWFPEFTVSRYSPVSFVELNDRNANCLGVMNFTKVMDKILGKQYNNVIETLPNALAQMSLKDRLRMYSKMRARAGVGREH